MVVQVGAILWICVAQQLDGGQDGEPRALYQRAAALIAEGELKAAIEPLEQLVDGHSSSALAEVATLYLAECHLTAQQPEAAYLLLEQWHDRLEASQTVERVVPKAVERARQMQLVAARQLAYQWEQSRDYARAWKWHRRAYGIDGEEDLSEDSLAREPQESERLRFCIAACLDALGRSKPLPGFIDELPSAEQCRVRFGLAEAMLARGQEEQASDQYDWLAEQSGKLADAPSSWLATVALRRCELRVRSKDFSSASALLKASRQQFPDFERAHEFDFLLARCAIAQIDFEAAIRYLENMTADSSKLDDATHARGRWMLGEVYFLQRDFPNALAAYEQVLRLDAPPWQARALLQKAKCLELQGDRAAAINSYQRLADQFHQSPVARDARRRLRLLKPELNR